MSFDLATAREGYKAQYPAYKELVERAKKALNVACQAERLVIEIDGRPKEVANFLRKAIRKHTEDPVRYSDPLTAIKDKAGIRAVVQHSDDAHAVREIVERVFDAFDFEDTATRLRPNELGYLGWHLQAKLRTETLGASDLYLRDLDFEVQIHTIAQHAWSVVSHPIVYKPVGQEADVEVASRIFRAVALVSIFDQEVSAVKQLVRESADYEPIRMLTALDRQFADWLTEPSDDQLSLQVLGVVAGAYTQIELEGFASLIDDFVRTRREQLDVVFAQHRIAEDYPLLLQPEMLAIYERLVNGKAKLRSVWLESPLPIEYLDEIAVAVAEPY